MKIPILIEPVANDGFQATSGPPLAVSAKGATQEEALARLRAEIDRRMAEGAVVVPLEIPTTEEKPSIWGIGMFRDDPLFDEWQEAIAENRRKFDEEEDNILS
jgi:predicted RNase H-like HicB family nuclease